MNLRWLAVALAALALVLVPVAVAARPAPDLEVSASDLAAAIRSSDGVAWSGLVESTGGLQLPSSDGFAGLGELFGTDNRLRVWWRGEQQWRIDRLRSTGEVDLIRNQGFTIRWEFETRTATAAPVSRIRLPDVSDLLPATLARFVLDGATDAELSRLPARRVAGIDAPGLRVQPAERYGTVAAVSIWADPVSGLPLRLELTGRAASREVLTTSLREVSIGSVPESVSVFQPSLDVDFRFDQSVDVAAEANALTTAALPDTLVGLPARDGGPGAVRAYGRGAVALIAIPLRAEVAGPLRRQLREGGAQRSELGYAGPAGAVGVFVTSGRLDRPGGGGGFLVAGTVDQATLRRAAAELVSR